MSNRRRFKEEFLKRLLLEGCHISSRKVSMIHILTYDHSINRDSEQLHYVLDSYLFEFCVHRYRKLQGCALLKTQTGHLETRNAQPAVETA